MPISADIRGRLSELNIGEVQVQQFGAPSDVLIRVAAQDGGESAEQTVVEQGPRRAAGRL